MFALHGGSQRGVAPHAPHESRVTVLKTSPSGPAEDEIITAQIIRCAQDGTVMVELAAPWVRTVPAQTRVAVNEADIGWSVARGSGVSDGPRLVEFHALHSRYLRSLKPIDRSQALTTQLVYHKP